MPKQETLAQLRERNKLLKENLRLEKAITAEKQKQAGIGRAAPRKASKKRGKAPRRVRKPSQTKRQRRAHYRPQEHPRDPKTGHWISRKKVREVSWRKEEPKIERKELKWRITVHVLPKTKKTKYLGSLYIIWDKDPTQDRKAVDGFMGDLRNTKEFQDAFPNARYLLIEGWGTWVGPEQPGDWFIEKIGE
jgi:hypothetical protein